MYEKVADAFEIPVGEIRLWHAYSGFGSDSLIERNTSKVTSEYSGTVFLQRKSLDESVGITDGEIVYFIRFDSPELDARLQYIGSHKGAKHDPVAAIFPAVAQTLGLPPGINFLASQ
jgi:hypothetical protein